MASASVAVANSSSGSLYSEALPLVDLAHLSQSELHALSLASAASFSSSSDFRRCDDVVVPKIDRSVFNESAGSRKQTYSRLRLAPRNPDISASSSSLRRLPKPFEQSADVVEGEDNIRIVTLLKALFTAKEAHTNANNDDDLVQVQVEYGDSVPNSSNVVLQTVMVDVANGNDVNVGVGEHTTGVIKRKRGRKRKNEMDIYVAEDMEGSEREILNKNGEVVDVARLGNVEDPYGPELRRRTEGMESQDELLGFLGALEGKWGSRRKKRKIVDASKFGDALPLGWKLLLSLKKKDGRAWLICRRYLSPNGRQFMSCKDVSSYLLTIPDLRDRYQPTLGNNTEFMNQMTSVNVADTISNDGSKREELASCVPAPIASMTSGHENQLTVLKVSGIGEDQAQINFKCHKCAMIFYQKDDLLHHLLSSHKRGRKRRKLGTSVSDGVIIKDGKYECQFCHKIFLERHRYNGHVGIHVKNYVNSVEASGGVATVLESSNLEFACGPLPASEMQMSSVTDRGSITETHNSRENGCLESGYSSGKLNDGCAGKILFDKHNNIPISMSQETQCDAETGVGEFYTDQNKECNMDIDKLKTTNGATDVITTENNSRLAACSISEKNDISDTFNKRSLLNQDADSTILVRNGKEKSSENTSPVSYAIEQTCGVENNLRAVPNSSLSESKQDVITGTGPFIFLKYDETRGAQDSVDMLFTSTTDEVKVDDEKKDRNTEPLCGVGSCSKKDGDAVHEIKQQEVLEGHLIATFGNDESGLVNPLNAASTSSMTESKEENLFDRHINNLSVCEQRHGAVGTVSGVSTALLDKTKFDDADNYGNNEKMYDFGSDHAAADADVNSTEQTKNVDSSLFVPFCSGQVCTAGNNVEGVSAGTMMKCCEEKSSNRSLAPPSRNGQFFGEIDVNAVSTSTTVQTELEKFCNYDQSTACTKIDMNSVTGFEKPSSDGFLLFPSDNKHVLGIHNNLTEVQNHRNLVEKSNHARHSPCSMYCQPTNVTNDESKFFTNAIEKLKVDEISNSWDDDIMISLGTSKTRFGLDVGTSNEPERSFESPPLVFPGSEQTFGGGKNITGIYNSAVENSNQPRTSESSLSNEQLSASNTNLNRVYSSPVWEENRLGTMQDGANNDELIMSLGRSHSQNEKDTVGHGVWRNDETVLQGGLNDCSLPMVHPSSYFSTFQGGNDFFSVGDKFNSMSDFDGLRSGSMEHMEFNFLTPQDSSFAPDSKVLSYNAVLEPGFDSSLWMASRNQSLALCVWCKSEFHHDSTNSGSQTSSIGVMCPDCKVKFSRQFNVY